MLQALPISNCWTQIYYPGPYVCDDPAKTDKMVARQNFLRTLRQLRKEEEFVLQEPVREVFEAYPQFKWDDGHLVYLPISAKRRRCQPCREIEQAKKPVQSVREIPDKKAGEL